MQFLGVLEPASVAGVCVGGKNRTEGSWAVWVRRSHWDSGAKMTLQSCSVLRQEDRALVSLKEPLDRVVSGEV